MGDIGKVANKYTDDYLGIDDPTIRAIVSPATLLNKDKKKKTPGVPDEPLPEEIDLTSASGALYRKLKKKNKSQVTQGVYGDYLTGPTLTPL